MPIAIKRWAFFNVWILRNFFDFSYRNPFRIGAMNGAIVIDTQHVPNN